MKSSCLILSIIAVLFLITSIFVDFNSHADKSEVPYFKKLANDIEEKAEENSILESARKEAKVKYNKCILENMSNAKSDLAAKMVEKSCRDIYLPDFHDNFRQ